MSEVLDNQNAGPTRYCGTVTLLCQNDIEVLFITLTASSESDAEVEFHRIAQEETRSRVVDNLVVGTEVSSPRSLGRETGDGDWYDLFFVPKSLVPRLVQQLSGQSLPDARCGVAFALYEYRMRRTGARRLVYYYEIRLAARYPQEDQSSWHARMDAIGSGGSTFSGEDGAPFLRHELALKVLATGTLPSRGSPDSAIFWRDRYCHGLAVDGGRPVPMLGHSVSGPRFRLFLA